LGPKVSGSQAQQGRPYTTFEKIKFLLDDKRIINRVNGLFVGSFYAFRAVIPPKQTAMDAPKQLAIWACGAPPGTTKTPWCSTFMIEDTKRDATNAWSGYSALAFLFEDDAKQNHLLAAAEEDIHKRGWEALWDTEMNMLLHPQIVFETWGGRIGPLRHIDVLYRVRATMVSDPVMQMRGGESLSITFGYPVCIASHPSIFSPLAIAPPSFETGLRYQSSSRNAEDR
jgi:hypothetical protein